MVLFIYFFIISQLLWRTDGFTVAVVEYKVITNLTLTTEELLTVNTDKYLEILDDAYNESLENLDLIIYPEATLTYGGQWNVNEGLVPYSTVLTTDEIPCNSSKYPEFIRRISCAAANYKVAIVVNLIENEECDKTDNNSTNCAMYGHRFYNTDAILDSDGSIINRYRKYNLFGEYELDRPQLEEIIFTIKNKTFGIITCFDLLFKQPSLELIDLNVGNIVYPTMWFSELPLLTALQAQQMWSHETGAILLAAGANYLAHGSGGSGVYNGGNNPFSYDIPTDGASHAYIVDIDSDSNFIDNRTIDELALEMDDFFIQVDPSIIDYESIILDTNRLEQTVQVCHNEFCCNFEISHEYDAELNGENQYVYHLTAYKGMRTFSGFVLAGIEVCAIIGCLDTTLPSCGQRFPDYNQIAWPLTFTKLSITANFSDGTRQYPNTLLSSIRPIPTGDLLWEEYNSQDGTERHLETNERIDRLLTFAIFARNFARDVISNACRKTINFIMIISSIYLIKFIY